MAQATIAPADAQRIMQEQIDKAVAVKVKAWEDKLEPLLPALEKAAKTAASRTGMTPEQVFSQMAGDSPDAPPAYILASNGQMIPYIPRSLGRRTKSVGYRPTPGNSSEKFSFGDFIRDSVNVQTRGIAGAGSSYERLCKMGVYTTREGNDGIYVKTALAESSGPTGGYGVPPQFMSELQRLEVEQEVLGSRARRLPMSTATLLLPSLDNTTVYGAGVTPFLGGVQAAWASEAGLISESEPQFRQTELRANQLSLFLVVSNVLLQDQSINLDALMTELLTDAEAWKSDYSYFQGNGAGQPMGVMNCGAVINVTRQSTGHVTFYDVRTMFSKLIYNNFDDPIWVAHPSCVDDFIGMNDTSGAAPSSDTGRGRLVFQPYDQGAQRAIDGFTGKQAFGRFLGFDIYLSEKLAKKGTQGDVLLVDAGKYLIGDRMATQIEASPHVFFKNYQTVIRAVSRKDGQPWLNNAVTLADGTFTQSPFIQLQ